MPLLDLEQFNPASAGHSFFFCKGETTYTKSSDSVNLQESGVSRGKVVQQLKESTGHHTSMIHISGQLNVFGRKVTSTLCIILPS
jgi:hypothetical protein